MKSLLLTGWLFLMFFTLFNLQRSPAQSEQPKSHQISYEVEQGKIYRTVDAGGRWKETLPLSDPVRLVAWVGDQPERVFAVGTSSAWLSHDGGGSWLMPSLRLPSGFEPTSLAIWKSNWNVVFLAGTMLGTDGSRRAVLWRSLDGGMTWSASHGSEAASVMLADSTKFWYGVTDIVPKTTRPRGGGDQR